MDVHLLDSRPLLLRRRTEVTAQIFTNDFRGAQGSQLARRHTGLLVSEGPFYSVPFLDSGLPLEPPVPGIEPSRDSGSVEGITDHVRLRIITNNFDTHLPIQLLG